MTRSRPTRLEWVLRIGAFMCFVGHGAFGILGKEAWARYFAVVGIGPEMAFTLMPLVGTLDIVMGILVLIRPRPAILLWMVAWAVWTALLRPLSGEPFWETLERAGNYGVPLALLVLAYRPGSGRRWWTEIDPPPMTPARLLTMRWVLAGSVLLLLVGHGALGVIGKQGLIVNYAGIMSVGMATAITVLVGWFEIALGFAAAAIAFPPLLIATSLWKMATEVLFIAAGAPMWEFIERGGSYTAPIALAMVIRDLVVHRKAGH